MRFKCRPPTRSKLISASNPSGVPLARLLHHTLLLTRRHWVHCNDNVSVQHLVRSDGMPPAANDTQPDDAEPEVDDDEKEKAKKWALGADLIPNTHVTTVCLLVTTRELLGCLQGTFYSKDKKRTVRGPLFDTRIKMKRAGARLRAFHHYACELVMYAGPVVDVLVVSACRRSRKVLLWGGPTLAP